MIKADGTAKVKAATLAFAAAVLLAPFPARPETRIKPIEAEEFQVRLEKTSRSGKVLLLEDPSQKQPKTGKILLLKDDESEIAAVRILKRYEGKFAAKIIVPFQEPRIGAEYRALRKLGDKIAALVPERERRVDEPDEVRTDEDLSREVSPEDEELDRGIPIPQRQRPTLPGGKQATEDGRPEPLFNKDGDEVTEVSQEALDRLDEDEAYYDPLSDGAQFLDPYNGAISMQYASIENVDKDGQFTRYSAIGGRYAYNFAKRILFSRRSLQDMLSLEIGAFYYTISNFASPDDSVTVVPVLPTLRYSLLAGPFFSFYAYGGALINTVASSVKVADGKASALAKTTPAAGAGAMLVFGPAWALRIEYGIDLLGLGIVLKF